MSNCLIQQKRALQFQAILFWYKLCVTEKRTYSMDCQWCLELIQTLFLGWSIPLDSSRSIPLDMSQSIPFYWWYGSTQGVIDNVHFTMYLSLTNRCVYPDQKVELILGCLDELYHKFRYFDHKLWDNVVSFWNWGANSIMNCLFIFPHWHSIELEEV